MVANKPSHKRNHHELPELYLRGFCDEPSFLWVYERGKPYSPGVKKRHKFNPCKLGVVKDLSEKDRYTTVKPDGQKDFESIENRHQKIEHKAVNILRKIRSQTSISIDEKEIFAEYIQNIHWRTKAHEEFIRPRLDMIHENQRGNNTALQLAQNGQFKLARELYDLQRYQKSDDGKRALILESMVTLHPMIHQILKSMLWTFYTVSSGNYFVTSNAPFVFDPIGLLESAWLFPISKEIVLIGTHDGKRDLEYVNTSSDETLAINYYSITQAPSVYAPKEDYWIWDFLENGTRINWPPTLGKLMPFRTNNSA